MPMYSYVCERCGPFSEIRPMAEFQEEVACPTCDKLCSRSMSLPFLNARRLDRSPRMTCEEPAAPRKRHASSCPCCH